MADFPVCPSSERTMSVLPPFCRGAVKTGRFYRKVVSANLFADTLPKSKDCTAQSLSRFATAPFAQGSPCRVPFSTRVPFGKQLYKFPIYLLTAHTHIRYVFYSIMPCSRAWATIFSKDSSLMSCSILQASALAFSRLTPSPSKNSRSRRCRL